MEKENELIFGKVTLGHKETTETPTIGALFGALRPCHAIKNFLLFIPFLVGHHYRDLGALGNSLIGFFVFCLLSSSTYVVNDLVDLEKDRQHNSKKRRPFASGALSPSAGIILAFCLAISALVIAYYLPLNFLFSAVLYYALGFLYSFFIKKKRWWDLILLTSLYCLRVFSGMTLVEHGYSLWLVIFVLFWFFSLALLKRYAELLSAKADNRVFILGRAYRLDDVKRLFFLGQFSAYLAILTFILYIHSHRVLLLYKQPLLLWLICPCLFIWIEHLWYCARRGEIHDDPVLFTISDHTSWIIAALIALAGWLAI